MPLEISSAALGGTPSEGGSGFNLIECRRIDNEWKDVHLNRYELRQGQYKCCETATLDLA